MSELQDNLLNIKQEKDTKILPGNIKKGITIYNITGTLEGGASNVVKQFNSMQEMQADPSPSDGDLATVYTNSQTGITADSEFQIATFPQTVVLSTPFSGYVNLGFSAVDQSAMFNSYGFLSSSGFMLSCYTSTGNIQIEYRSQDGLTYTRNRFAKNNQEVSGDEMDFSTIIKYSATPFNSALSNFILIGSAEYFGLYKYSSEDNRYDTAPTSLSANPETVYEGTFYGKNGVQEGNLSNTNNLNVQEVRNRTDLYSNLSYLELNENVTNLSRAFASCYNITTVPNFNTSNVTDMSNMFNSCYNLTTVPNFNTSNVTYMTSMFLYCNSLVNVPQFNTLNVVNMYSMFRYCNNLSDASIQNIINMCLNSNVSNSTLKNLSNANTYSPLYYTNITSSRYSNRLTELSSAGWSY